ncbi:hypothetical protein HYPSUDRAFT_33971 [Hypholoma sublateritium FD-334 SS-4]|uniref:Uncharacterized protein n=1 Tax=Hypholoma sublateritium (strain FD-334 SS-4) TaxID=945553 RepID=A0A0D2PJE5_HYPSF|nr:hypothetical protein HYPSUDRAFT_33971 [Hypholoma sublateritium FD-334 SS-4]
MFKLSRAYALISMAVSTLSANTSPAMKYAAIEAGGANASVKVDICTGDIGTGCANIPIDSGSCINLDGGLVFFNKEISTAIIPYGTQCTFFEDFGCFSEQGAADSVSLAGGTWNFSHVPGAAEITVDFNDLTSSFNCSQILLPQN